MRDDFDAVVADRFKVLDHVPVPDTWSRVQRSRQAQHGPKTTGAVLTMLDLETPVPNEPRHKRPMRVVVAAVVTAAAVAAIALVVTRDRHDGAPADEPAPTFTVPPTTPPRALFATVDEDFVPGTYFVDEVDGTPTARIFVTIGAGWSNFIEGHAIGKLPGAVEGDVGFITFSRPDRVFSDACHWSDGFYPGPVTTLDGLVAALSEQGGWVDVTAPSDISVNGYNGKAFQRTTPVMYSCDTDEAFRPRFPTRQHREDGSEPAFRSWENENASNFGGWYYESGQMETVWVLDIDGTLVVINANLFPGSSAADRAEFAAVLDSIRIDRG
jgi:hypothetical protein